MSKKIQYKNPDKEIIPSQNYLLKINGENIFVYESEIGSIAVLSAEGLLHVEIEVRFAYTKTLIRPLSLGIKHYTKENKLFFDLDNPCKLSIEFDDDIRNPLFLLINPPENSKLGINDPKVRCFEGGKIHEAGIIELKNDETVYIEEGAVVRGTIIAQDADNITIRGRGILDGSLLSHKEAYKDRRRMIQLAGCKNVLLEGITVFNGNNWHVVPIACENVTLKNLNIITWAGTGDGIDIVGSENVDISNCFIRSNDDCIAIKAVGYFHEKGMKDVRNVHVTSSVFWNAEWGNALEIGYETRCSEISGIVFEDCDVIRCEKEGYQSGGTFTIHNGDRAVIKNILYANIRVEDSREKLIDIKVLHSQYSKDQQRGQVRDIQFSNIQITDGPFPVSIIQGYDENHLIENVTIEDLTVLGEKINDAASAKMVIELSKYICFK